MLLASKLAIDPIGISGTKKYLSLSCSTVMNALMSDSIERLIRQLHQTYHGPSWHGPTLKELLEDVSAKQAAKKGIRNAHSIWAIVLHAAAWKRAV